MEAIKNIISAAQAEINNEFNKEFSSLEELSKQFHKVAHDYAARVKKMKEEVIFTPEEVREVANKVSDYILLIYNNTGAELRCKLRDSYRL